MKKIINWLKYTNFFFLGRLVMWTRKMQCNIWGHPKQTWTSGEYNKNKQNRCCYCCRENIKNPRFKTDPPRENRKVDNVKNFEDFKFIYTVTSVTIRNNKIDHERCRTWGWFSNFEQANKAVRENLGDMHETTYNYIIVEKHIEGIMGVAFDEKPHVQWYKWKRNLIDGNFKPCKVPECAGNTIGFGMS